MNEHVINLIFDCDGTLIDSYGAIVDRIDRAFRQHGFCYDAEEMRQICLYHDAGTCIRTLADRSDLPREQLCREITGIKEKLDCITLIPGAEELLEDKRFFFFVYTHRDATCHTVFSSLGIEAAFTEIVDSTYGFRRKPDGQGVEYLVEKYHMDRAHTYYVGDRLLDIECGKNAGVGTIFLKSSGLDIDSSAADYTVTRLDEIRRLPL